MQNINVVFHCIYKDSNSSRKMYMMKHMELPREIAVRGYAGDKLFQETLKMYVNIENCIPKKK